MISEKIIVRASNPGQFDNLESVSESNGGSGPWNKDPSTGTVYHLGEYENFMTLNHFWIKLSYKRIDYKWQLDFNCLIGNVGINTSNASEALAIHGNIQMTGAILQPSDMRIKKVSLVHFSYGVIISQYIRKCKIYWILI